MAPHRLAVGMTLVPNAMIATARERYWIIAHGIRMSSGMPAWRYRLRHARDIAACLETLR